MKVRELLNINNGTRWDIYKKAENQYYIKYYEFYKSCGWKLLFQDGGSKANALHSGTYYSKVDIEDTFGIIVP